MQDKTAAVAEDSVVAVHAVMDSAAEEAIIAETVEIIVDGEGDEVVNTGVAVAVAVSRTKLDKDQKLLVPHKRPILLEVESHHGFFPS